MKNLTLPVSLLVGSLLVSCGQPVIESQSSATLSVPGLGHEGIYRSEHDTLRLWSDGSYLLNSKIEIAVSVEQEIVQRAGCDLELGGLISSTASTAHVQMIEVSNIDHQNLFGSADPAAICEEYAQLLRQRQSIGVQRVTVSDEIFELIFLPRQLYGKAGTVGRRLIATPPTTPEQASHLRGVADQAFGILFSKEDEDSLLPRVLVRKLGGTYDRDTNNEALSLHLYSYRNLMRLSDRSCNLTLRIQSELRINNGEVYALIGDIHSVALQGEDQSPVDSAHRAARGEEVVSPECESRSEELASLLRGNRLKIKFWIGGLNPVQRLELQIRQGDDAAEPTIEWGTFQRRNPFYPRPVAPDTMDANSFSGWSV